MSINIFVTFVVLSGFIFQTHTLSVVNNVTISSDFMQEIFFNEIRLDFNLSDIIGVDVTKAQKCILQLQEIVNEFPSINVAPFVDSWGKLPSGILYGHLTDLGNYDQCVRTSVNFNDSSELTKGQYCFASIPLSSSQQFSQNELLLLGDALIGSRAIFDLLNIKLGVCVPDTCDPRVVTKVFQSAAANVLNGTFSGVTVSRCSVAKKPSYKAADIFAIVFFSVFGFLMLSSSLYDCYSMYTEKRPAQLLIAFSVITNGSKLFMINTKKSTNSIDCLTGIRVFSMAWVLFCHNYLVFLPLNIVNIVDMLSWYKNAWPMAVLMGTVSVDTFFFLSGLLVAWLGLRELDRTSGKLNVIMMWVHRYIRLTPPLAAVILFLVTLNRFIGSGPYREDLNKLHSYCTENWWTTLLYVQNYVNPKKMCVVQSWYLAVDTQLYMLSPLVLLPLWKWGKKFIPVLGVVSLLSIGCIIATFVVEEYTSLIGLTEPGRSERTYFPTHARCSVWLLGISVGYFMYINKQRSIRLPKMLQLLGWTVCFVIILSVIFGPYFKISSSTTATVAEAATYEALKRIAWGFALGWIVFACHFGFGGVINSLLSHPFWQPIGRLTYCLYLVHIAVQSFNFGIIRTDVYFSDYSHVLYFWSTFGISLMVAIVLSLAFEAPVLVIEKIIFSGEKSCDHKGVLMPSAPIDSSIDIACNKKV